jgi:hypothetical protein
MIVEKQMECRLAGETEVLGENLPQRHFCPAQTVSRWLLTAAARVCVRAACGICGGQSGIGAGLLPVVRFPLLIIPPIYPS